MRRLALAGFILFGSVFTPLIASAQECEIDLTDALIALTQAQADAASGDNTSALAAIADVQADLETMRQNCLAADASLNNLTQTFTEPDFFSFQYPAAWFVGEFHEGMDWEMLGATVNSNDLPLPLGGTVTVTSEEVSANYSNYIALEGVQSVTVTVGTPLHLLTELGIYSQDFLSTFLEGDFDFDALTAELENRLRQSPAAEDLVVTPVETERPTVAYEASSTNTDITMVLVNLDEANNWYALLISPTIAADEHVDMLPLLLSMAETVE